MTEGKEQYICNCCSHEREQKAQSPRYLEEIPREAIAEGFKKDAPAFLCYYCDGDASDLAKEHHRELDEEDVG
jgi:hypothetical protein